MKCSSIHREGTYSIHECRLEEGHLSYHACSKCTRIWPPQPHHPPESTVQFNKNFGLTASVIDILQKANRDLLDKNQELEAEILKLKFPNPWQSLTRTIEYQQKDMKQQAQRIKNLELDLLRSEEAYIALQKHTMAEKRCDFVEHSSQSYLVWLCPVCKTSKLLNDPSGKKSE